MPYVFLLIAVVLAVIAQIIAPMQFMINAPTATTPMNNAFRSPFPNFKTAFIL